MNFPFLHDVASALKMDCALLRADINSGEPIPINEVLSLGALVQSVCTLTTFRSRELDRVQDQYSLWAEVSDLLDELCNSWAGIDCDDHLVQWLVRRSGHFSSLARDRMELYKISSAERIAHSKIRGDVDLRSSFTERHEIEPQGRTSHGAPQHVYRIGHF
jgi:hypothetical protein